jgi:hypothetical protein
VLTPTLGYVTGLDPAGLDRMLLPVVAAAAPPGLQLLPLPVDPPPLDGRQVDGRVSLRRLREAAVLVDALLVVAPVSRCPVAEVVAGLLDWSPDPWRESALDHFPSGLVSMSSPAEPVAPSAAVTTAGSDGPSTYALVALISGQPAAPEAFLRLSPASFEPGGRLRDEASAQFLRMFLSEVRDHVLGLTAAAV